MAKVITILKYLHIQRPYKIKSYSFKTGYIIERVLPRSEYPDTQI